ncbi:LysR family transcriptional regulator [Piscinibacter sakaiensis]|uniref:Transcriptional regulator, LysR family n=1 Tax=Piscinibacter sakaiensis TaxID=1547922 RepID=A0A0K8P5U8_PISS1|nr:LysR family transcriptional regulator [Piscinibacter sakaiensis]GAP37982.1 transcriptional regulator, LysR family [Piscinibacter sakaiensis]
MGIRELRALVAVAERGTLAAAGDALFLSTPAISAQLAKLEQALGAELFDRTRKPARLTQSGQAVLARAREVIDLYDRLAESISEPAELTGSFVLGSIPTALTSVIPKALLALRSAHPRLQVRIHHGLSPSFVEMLRQGDVDAAITSEPREPAPDLVWDAFADEPVLVIAPQDARGDSDEALLRDYPYIRFNRHFWVSRRIEEALANRRIVLRESMELDSLEAIALMVRHGLGVSIVPVSHAGFLRFHRLRALPFGRPPMARAIGLAQRPGGPKRRLAAALLAALQQAARAGRQKLP